MRTVPLTLGNVTLSMFREDALGNPISSQRVFWGARTERLVMWSRVEEVEMTPSGSAARQYGQLGLEHMLEMDEIWVLEGSTRRPFSVGRGKYVLMIYGEDPRTGIWYRRTYYGVQTVEGREESVGQTYFNHGKRFRARTMVEDDGRLSSGEASVPPVPELNPQGPEESHLYIHPGALTAGSYFAGVYQFDTAKRVTFAKVIANASQGTATTIRLQVGGVMEPDVTLVIPTGDLNTEVEASGEFAVDIAANQTIRWKVVSGPAALEDAAWQASVVMNLKTLG